MKFFDIDGEVYKVEDTVSVQRSVGEPTYFLEDGTEIAADKVEVAVNKLGLVVETRYPSIEEVPEVSEGAYNDFVNDQLGLRVEEEDEAAVRP